MCEYLFAHFHLVTITADVFVKRRYHCKSLHRHPSVIPCFSTMLVHSGVSSFMKVLWKGNIEETGCSRLHIREGEHMVCVPSVGRSLGSGDNVILEYRTTKESLPVPIIKQIKICYQAAKRIGNLILIFDRLDVLRLGTLYKLTSYTFAWRNPWARFHRQHVLPDHLSRGSFFRSRNSITYVEGNTPDDTVVATAAVCRGFPNGFK